MDSIRVVIADDQALLREGVHQFLQREHGIKVIAHAGDEVQVEEVVEKHKPDVLLLAPSCFKNLKALRALQQKSPPMRIIILHAEPPEKELLDYLKAGAKGTISKRETQASLAKAIRVVNAGEVWVRRTVIVDVINELSELTIRIDDPAHVLEGRLSQKEYRVAERVASGCSNQGVAKDLGLSEKTVKNHLSKIYQKCGLANRNQLTALLLQRGRKDKNEKA